MRERFHCSVHLTVFKHLKRAVRHSELEMLQSCKNLKICGGLVDKVEQIIVNMA